MKVYIITETDKDGSEQIQTVKNPFGSFSNVFVHKYDAQWAWENYCATKLFKEGVKACLHELDTEL